MEHEFFQSELKPLVDDALVPDIIRSSSSGLNSHRAAAIELILERSIQDRRERMLTKAKSRPRPNPTPQPESEAPDAPTPRVQSPTSATASQPPSRSLPNDTTGTATGPTPAPANHKSSQDPPTLPKPAKEVKVAQHEEPSADAKTNPSPPEDTVELVCLRCHVKKLRSDLWAGVYCGSCPWPWSETKCVGCGTIRVSNVGACASCHGKFKESSSEDMCTSDCSVPVKSRTTGVNQQRFRSEKTTPSNPGRDDHRPDRFWRDIFL